MPSFALLQPSSPSQAESGTVDHGSSWDPGGSSADSSEDASGMSLYGTLTSHHREQSVLASTARPDTADLASYDTAIFWRTMDGSDASGELTARVAHRGKDSEALLETEIHILNHRRLHKIRCAVSQLIDSARSLGIEPSNDSEEGRKRCFHWEFQREDYGFVPITSIPPQQGRQLSKHVDHLVSLLLKTPHRGHVTWTCDFLSNLSSEDAADLIECKIRVEQYSPVPKIIVLDVVTRALHRTDIGHHLQQNTVVNGSPLTAYGGQGLTDDLRADRFFEPAVDGNESDGNGSDVTDMELD